MLQLTQLIGFGVGDQVRVMNLIVSEQLDRINAASLAQANGWDGIEPIHLTITLTTWVHSTVHGISGFTTGVFPVGSTLRLINKGNITSRGGDGGSGIEGANVNGGNGTPAISLQFPLILDNTDGYIFGPGGGGGGVRIFYLADGRIIRWAGGGGGQGWYPGGLGGKTGVSDTTGQVTSTDGVNGQYSEPGAGGVHHNNTTDYGDSSINGASGGAWAVAGANGTVSYAAGAETVLGIGGLPGKAIALNGHAVTWLGGNNPTRVLGEVS